MGRKQCPFATAVKRNLLPLNNTLPSDLASIWLTSEEIYERLIFSGVDRSLTITMIRSALQHNNDNHMAVWEYGGMNYFRSKESDLVDEKNKVPLEQRFKRKSGHKHRVMANPVRDYFVSHASDLLTTINRALLQIEKMNSTPAIITPAKQEKSEYFFYAKYIISHYLLYQLTALSFSRSTH